MNKMISKLSDSSKSIEELKLILNISDRFPTKLSNTLSESIALQFLNNQLTYDGAATAINHLFMIWMSKPYTEDFGSSAWHVHIAFDKADEHYDESNMSLSIQRAKEFLQE